MIYHRKKGEGAEGGSTGTREQVQQVVWCTRPLYFKRGLVAFGASSPSRHPRFNLRVGLQQLQSSTTFTIQQPAIEHSNPEARN